MYQPLGVGKETVCVDDDVGGLGSGFDGGSVDIGLEGGADLALGLGGAVELGEREVAPANHREDLSVGVVHGHHCGLGSGVLLEGDVDVAVREQAFDADVGDVACAEELVCLLELSPLPVFLEDDGGFGT